MTDKKEKIIKYLMLSQIKGFGPIMLNILLDICGGATECFLFGYDELKEADKNHKIGSKRLQSFIKQRDDEDIRSRAEEILEASNQKGITIITKENSAFPERLSGINDSPILLYAKGELRLNDFKDSIGVVGARRCSAEGKAETIRIVYEEENKNSAVISGMAKGIDSYAHTAAIKSNRYTIAVLGNGVDICYPKEHERLYEEIAAHGCILSEYPPGTKPAKYSFPKRNRIIAALSDTIYVVDAGRNSGTESTVEFGDKYGRKIVKIV